MHKLKSYQYDLAEEDVYCVGMFFVKCSILVFYFRLNPNRRFRQLAWAIIAFVFACSLVSILGLHVHVPAGGRAVGHHDEGQVHQPAVLHLRQRGVQHLQRLCDLDPAYSAVLVAADVAQAEAAADGGVYCRVFVSFLPPPPPQMTVNVTLDLWLQLRREVKTAANFYLISACIVAILRIVTMMPYTHSNDATWFKRIIANWW